ncbi:hypothetical protein KIH86_23120 [Paenibacillus sp. HN-1]|uniref:hypothetical protein n=1 Tax=Paenibacillus TaxID=44249 RepID=UPI001CA8E6E6|nr:MULTISPECIES: hypothetical protein [Paenibacillus]MBY9081048.1 hypothetical protein [Paenibacillus sp. CGMCC 1.18879]MBY9087085.1 hypothetical protein [Paenibacillus sinensis]
MSTAFSADVSGKRIEVGVTPPNTYSPAVLSISQQAATFQLHADPEQLAEVEFAIRTYLDSIKYPQPVPPAAKEEIA